MANIISMDRICDFQGGGEIEQRLQASTPPTYVIREVTDWRVRANLDGMEITNAKLVLTPAVGAPIEYPMSVYYPDPLSSEHYYQVTISASALSSLTASGYAINITWTDTSYRPNIDYNFGVSELYGDLIVKNMSKPIIEKYTAFRCDASGNADALGEYISVNLTASSELPGVRFSLSSNPSISGLPYSESTTNTVSYSGIIGPGFTATTSYRLVLSVYDSVNSQTLRTIVINAQTLVFDAYVNGANKGFRFFGKASADDAGMIAFAGRIKVEDTTGTHKGAIRAGEGTDAVVLEPVANSNTNALWVGLRGSATKAFIGPYTNKEYNLGNSTYMFDNAYFTTAHFGGTYPQMTSSSSQDWHMLMSESNYGVYYGVTESMWSFYPRTNQTSNLGTPNKRWLTIYSKNALNTSSDERLKKDIKPLADNYKKMIMDLKPVSFLWRDGDDSDIHTGLIAQDVEKVMNANGIESGIVAKGDAEKMYALRYEELIAPMISVIQDQQEKINKLEKLVNQLIADNEDDMR